MNQLFLDVANGGHSLVVWAMNVLTVRFGLWLLVRIAPVFLPLKVSDGAYRRLMAVLEKRLSQALIACLVGTVIWIASRLL